MSEPPSSQHSEAPRPAGPRPRGGLKIGTIAGADVLVSRSWFVIAGLIALLVSPRIEQVEPGLGPWKYVAGLVFAVILYLSVLLHEASHAWMARRYGYPVSSITLHFLGGMTAVEGESRTAREEFWIAFVGPVTSLAIGGGALGLLVLNPEGLLQVGVEGLAVANLLIGLMNLAPALPLDGGRVLKATVWKVTGSQHRGSLVAGWAGRLLAVVVLGWPLYQEAFFGVEPMLVDYLLGAVLAIFLWGGATAAIIHAKIRQRLPLLVARTLARRAIAVPADLPLSEAVRRAQEERAGSIVTLDAQDAPEGLVSESALLAVPVERRPWVPVRSVARTLDQGLTLPASIEGEALISAMGRRPAEEYLLVHPDGVIHGVLATVDVDRAFRGAHD